MLVRRDIRIEARDRLSEAGIGVRGLPQAQAATVT
jgi:hypothetical protein